MMLKNIVDGSIKRLGMFRRIPRLVDVLTEAGCYLPEGVNTPVGSISDRAWVDWRDSGVVNIYGPLPAEWLVLHAVVGRWTVGVLFPTGETALFTINTAGDIPPVADPAVKAEVDYCSWWATTRREDDAAIQAALDARRGRLMRFVDDLETSANCLFNWDRDTDRTRVGIGPMTDEYYRRRSTDKAALQARLDRACRRVTKITGLYVRTIYFALHGGLDDQGMERDGWSVSLQY